MMPLFEAASGFTGSPPSSRSRRFGGGAALQTRAYLVGGTEAMAGSCLGQTVRVSSGIWRHR